MTLIGYSTTWRRNTHVRLVDRKSKRILRSSEAANAESIAIIETDIMMMSTGIRHVGNSWRNGLSVLPEMTMNGSVSDKTQEDGNGGQQSTPDNESNKESGYGRRNYDEVRFMIQQASRKMSKRD